MKDKNELNLQIVNNELKIIVGYCIIVQLLVSNEILIINIVLSQKS